MVWLVRKLGPVVAARISRFLVGEETPLEFASKGKLKTKGKRSSVKGSPGSGAARPAAKRFTASTPEREHPAEEEPLQVKTPPGGAGSASYQELAPLASFQDEEATATADALAESVEWTVQEGKRCGGRPKVHGPALWRGRVRPPPPPPPARAPRLRLAATYLAPSLPACAGRVAPRRRRPRRSLRPSRRRRRSHARCGWRMTTTCCAASPRA